jgi:tyrosyl-DNA phosphodiesterase 2
MQLDDHQLLDKNGLTDAWVALHGTSASGGDTWNVGVIHWEGIGGHRLDKVAMMDVQAEEMEVLRRGCIDVPRPDGEGYVEVPWSEHLGLRCTIVL